MNRRGFLLALAAVPVALAAKITPKVAPRATGGALSYQHFQQMMNAPLSGWREHIWITDKEVARVYFSLVHEAEANREPENQTADLLRDVPDQAGVGVSVPGGEREDPLLLRDVPAAPESGGGGDEDRSGVSWREHPHRAVVPLRR